MIVVAVLVIVVVAVVVIVVVMMVVAVIVRGHEAILAYMLRNAITPERRCFSQRSPTVSIASIAR